MDSILNTKTAGTAGPWIVGASDESMSGLWTMHRYMLAFGGRRMKCIECDRLLKAMGFGYYHHPPLLDHYKRIKSDAYQCSQVNKIRKLG